MTADKLATGLKIVTKSMEIKVELFEVMMQQSSMQDQLNQIEQYRQQKLKVLQQALNEEAEAAKVKADLLAAETVPLPKVERVINEVVIKAEDTTTDVEAAN